MRQVRFDRPFIGGVITDQPSYKVGIQNSIDARDLVAPRGLARQRMGWEYDGDQTVAKNLRAIHKNKFVLNGSTRTAVCASDGYIYSHQASGAGTSIWAGSVEYIPRTVYRDQVVFCAQDGLSPARLWSGAEVGTTGTSNQWDIQQGQLIGAGGGTFAATPERGNYVQWGTQTAKYGIPIYPRILEVDESGTDYATLEDVLYPADAGYGGTLEVNILQTGMAWPCVSIYEAGVAQYTNSTFTITGQGTKWSTGGLPLLPDSDIVVLVPGAGADAQAFNFATVASDTSLTICAGGDATDVGKSNYRIQRRLPCKDAVAHKDSLFITGFNGYPNRVWVGPQGWNPAIPPGDIPPFNPGSDFTRSNDADFTLDYIDVPASYDGDSNVALLSSEDPVLCIKRKNAYGIYGDFPHFERIILSGGEGSGCIDIRSAQNLSIGPVWAGEDGIYTFRGGRVVDLTLDKISRDWQALTGSFTYGTDWCSIGEHSGCVYVTISISGTETTFLYDARLDAWISDSISNHGARYYASVRLEDEPEQLLWVDDDHQGRVMDSSGVIVPSSTTPAIDEDGTEPVLWVETGDVLDGEEAVDGDSRVLDIAISANLVDSLSSTGTNLTATLISSGGLFDPDEASLVLSPVIYSDDVDSPRRAYFSPVNQDGRQHKLRLVSGGVGTDASDTKVEIPEFTVTVSDLRVRS